MITEWFAAHAFKVAGSHGPAIITQCKVWGEARHVAAVGIKTNDYEGGDMHGYEDE